MDTAARLAAIAEGDGLEEGTDLAAVTAVFGQEAGGDLDPLSPLDPVDGRELLAATEPEGPDGDLAGGSPGDAGPAVREKAMLGGPRRSDRLPAGPSDPVLLEKALAELERMVGWSR